MQKQQLVIIAHVYTAMTVLCALQIIGKRILIQGFIVGDWMAAVGPKFGQDMSQVQFAATCDGMPCCSLYYTKQHGMGA